MVIIAWGISHGEGIKLAQKRNETPVIIDWGSFVDMWNKYKSLPDALESKSRGIGNKTRGKLPKEVKSG